LSVRAGENSTRLQPTHRLRHLPHLPQLPRLQHQPRLQAPAPAAAPAPAPATWSRRQPLTMELHVAPDPPGDIGGRGLSWVRYPRKV